MRYFDLLIFDFDGTLADSLPPALIAIQEMLKKLGYPEKSIAQIQPHVGYGEEYLVAGAIGSKDSAEIQRARDVYFEIYRGKLKNIKLYPRVKEFVEHFKEKKLVVVSNKRTLFIELILENLGIKEYFTALYGEGNSACLKPDPCLVLELMSKFKVKAEKTLFIGDMTIDVQTGKNAGVATCAVTYGFESREKLVAAKPDYLVDDLLALAEQIN
ncbi:HAD family hydrolase [Candidatus Saganbacteria bacterium]|nr:HAD family hydrolase [Candidatus Saganbacteria bacterium]